RLCHHAGPLTALFFEILTSGLSVPVVHGHSPCHTTIHRTSAIERLLSAARSHASLWAWLLDPASALSSTRCSGRGRRLAQTSKKRRRQRVIANSCGTYRLAF